MVDVERIFHKVMQPSDAAAIGSWAITDIFYRLIEGKHTEGLSQ